MPSDSNATNCLFSRNLEKITAIDIANDIGKIFDIKSGEIYTSNRITCQTDAEALFIRRIYFDSWTIVAQKTRPTVIITVVLNILAHNTLCNGFTLALKQHFE